jgi:hypothetical protein
VTYAVVWRRVVLDMLADHYITLPLADQRLAAAGVASLNSRLASDPFEVGEGRDDDSDRIAFLPLLCVSFEVDPASRTVRVTGVSRSGR